MTFSAATVSAWRRERLAEGGTPTSLAWLLDVGAGLEPRAYHSLTLHPQATVQLSRDLDELTRLWHRHLKQEPLQYLLGRCPWRDFMLTVAPGVLIPRPETELLADVAISLMDKAPAGPGLWADLGTGSGCLALALAKAFPKCHGMAVDQDSAALKVAARNLESVAGQVRLLAGNWWQPLRPWWGRLTMVVSNPPYIPTPTLAQLDPVVRCHEPRPALDGGPDGLGCFRAVLAGVSALAPGGWLVMEHGQGQAPALEPLFAAAGLRAIRRHQDLEGNDRFLAACTPHHWP
ncbi:MAG: peptide chain release factor N(5)-glutamine methyltransferase [Synechococcus sp. SB0668_bin_15]|nr:peptide chain release factor N(5)-glutamine methyltransferase [Synechococcus sp. SB0668_bin_15]MYC49808.1 peptide chain release factor N(5)-glutamine methyltransferase [Synechococcus sp. SB0662_bin_14]